MVVSLKPIELLEKKGALSTLLLLYTSEKKAWMITELLASIDRSQRALYSAVQRLRQLQLVEERRQPEYNRRYLALTERGEAVARKLVEITNLLGDE